MNNFLGLDGTQWWHVAGWTMLHYLWLGALTGLAAGVCRVIVRRAPANIRYAAAVVCLAVLAALPIGIGAWLVAQPQAMRTPSMLIALGEAPRQETSEVIELAVTRLEEPPVTGTTGSAGDPFQSPTPVAGSRNLQRLAESVAQSVAGYLPWLWFVGTPLTFALLTTGIVGAERLRRDSRIVDEGPIADCCRRLSAAMHISRRVSVAVCERLAAPVLVGIVRPIILLPPAALSGWSPDEIEMVLVHELAHVRRWDNLVNLLQRILESVLFFHPAVWLVSTWVRREREICCDEVVVGRTNQSHAYAEMLVAFATRLCEPSGPGRSRPRLPAFRRGRGRPGSLVSSAMAAGPLRSRIRRILQLEDDPMLVSGKSLAVVMSSLLLVAVFVVLYVPSRGQAKESAKDATERIERAQGPAQNASDPSASVRDDWTLGKKPLDVASPSDKWVTRFYHAPTTKLPRDERAEFERQLRQFDPPKNSTFRWSGETVAVFGPPEMHAHVQELFEQANDFPFLSLEDQKLADLAWKRMGQELEPIGEEDRTRIQAFGYDGGLRVTGLAGVTGNNIQPGDILVGLHVWPITSLKDVGEVLQREDISEFNPLKFYVIRPGAGPHQGGRFVRPEEDELITGRISVNVADRRTSQATPVQPRSAIAVDARNDAVPLPTTTTSDNVDLRYDGKTFDEWRTAWRTEISPEKRLEVVKALAAFGASGHGREAAEEILNVAKQLDFRTMDDSSAGRLKRACVEAFVGGTSTGGYRIRTADWLPLLTKEIESKTSAPLFGTYVLMRIPEGEDDAIPILLALSENEEFQGEALAGLKAVDPRLDDERVLTRFRQALVESNGSPEQLAQRIGCFLYLEQMASGASAARLRLTPEIEELLFHPILDVRQQARAAIRHIRQRDAATLVKHLEKIVDDVSSADRVEAIRALAVLGDRAKSIESRLKEIAHTETDPGRFAAALALLRIRPEIDEWHSRDKYSELFGAAGQNSANFKDLEREMDDESQELLPKDENRILGNGGGIF